MYCPKCGKELDASRVMKFCPYCGSDISRSVGSETGHPEREVMQQKRNEISQPSQPDNKIKNYLVESILVTLFCCLPLGIAGIVYASKVDGLVQRGQYGEAQEMADKAKQFSIIGAVIGAIAVLVMIASSSS